MIFSPPIIYFQSVICINNNQFCTVTGPVKRSVSQYHYGEYNSLVFFASQEPDEIQMIHPAEHLTFEIFHRVEGVQVTGL